MGVEFTGPSYARPATPYERQSAGAAQGRIEATLHSYLLDLINGLADPDWWGKLVVRAARERARKEANKDGSSTDHQALLKRVPFEELVRCFRDTFRAQFESLFGTDEHRQAWITHTLMRARDAAAHPGKPYSAAEATLAAFACRDIASRTPQTFHDPHDLIGWFDALGIGESEGWHDMPFDIVEDCPVTPELWLVLAQHLRRFRQKSTGGDHGFADSIEEILAAEGLDVFMRRGELTLGTGLPGISGLFHEHDLGVRGRSGGHSVLVILEMKYRTHGSISKDDLLLFNQKTLDFQLAMTTARDGSRLVRALITNAAADQGLHAWALAWGILLVEPTVDPVPVLLAAARDASHVVPNLESQLQMAERLGACIRPLDRVLIPSTLTPSRRLLDLSATPTARELQNLVLMQKSLGARLRRALVGTRND